MHEAGVRAARAAGATLIIWLSGALFALQPLSTDLYLPTMPSIGADFGAGVAAVQWTLSAFMASFALSQLIAGPLSDRYGRLPVIMAGVSIHCAASLLCMLAPSIGLLIAGRVLQGAGTCTSIIAARAIARDLHGPHEGARLLAAAGAVMGLAIVAGPILGAQLQLALGWRAAFGFLAACSLALTIACALLLRETNLHRQPGALAPRTLLGTYASVWRSASFRAFSFVNASSYAGLFAFLASSSFVLIRVRHLSVGAFGFCFSLAVSGFLVGTLACRRRMRGHTLVATLRLGAALQCAAGVLLVALWALGIDSVAAIVAPMFLYVVSHGFLQPLSQAGSVASFPRNAGAAAALQGFLVQIAAAGVGAVISASWDGSARPMTLAIGVASVLTLALSRRTLSDVSHGP